MPASPDALRDLYKSLTGRGADPLDPDNPYYVPILQATPEKDPILMLWQRLDWEESESVNLLTGFRGNGKSTELRRLKRLLEERSGAKVFLINMADALLMTKPLEISDFLLSLMAALGKAVDDDSGLGALTHSYWERLGRFLKSKVELDVEFDLGAAGAPAKLGLMLKNEPDFKARVQEHLRGHLSRLIEDAQAYIIEMVGAIRSHHRNPDLKVVLLVDSVEQIRGVGTEAEDVHNSVVELFSGHAANLQLPMLHVVYTVPPYLPTLSQNLGRSLGGHPIVSWPNIHVRNRDGSPDPVGLHVVESIIERRHASWRDILPPESLARLATCAGGDLRDFFRLVRDCAVSLQTARASRPDAVLDNAILERVKEQLRNELLPLAEDDARWLARIHKEKEPSLPSTKDLPSLARFLDGNLIMNYLNGQPWYDIHPLLIEEIRRFIDNGGAS